MNPKTSPEIKNEQNNSLWRKLFAQCSVFSFGLICLIGITGCASTQTERRNQQGLEYFNQARYDDAVKEFQQAIQESPNDARAYLNTAITYHKQASLTKQPVYFTQARQYYELALTKNPDQETIVASYRGLAILLTENSQRDEALTILRAWEKNNPDAVDPKLEIAFLLDSQLQTEQAKLFLETAVQLAPDDYRAYYKLADIAQQQGDYETAIRYYEKANSLHPQETEIATRLQALQAQIAQNSVQVSSPNILSENSNSNPDNSNNSNNPNIPNNPIPPNNSDNSNKPDNSSNLNNPDNSGNQTVPVNETVPVTPTTPETPATQEAPANSDAQSAEENVSAVFPFDYSSQEIPQTTASVETFFPKSQTETSSDAAKSQQSNVEPVLDEPALKNDSLPILETEPTSGYLSPSNNNNPLNSVPSSENTLPGSNIPDSNIPDSNIPDSDFPDWEGELPVSQRENRKNSVRYVQSAFSSNMNQRPDFDPTTRMSNNISDKFRLDESEPQIRSRIIIRGQISNTSSADQDISADSNSAVNLVNSEKLDNSTDKFAAPNFRKDLSNRLSDGRTAESVLSLETIEMPAALSSELASGVKASDGSSYQSLRPVQDMQNLSEKRNSQNQLHSSDRITGKNNNTDLNYLNQTNTNKGNINQNNVPDNNIVLNNVSSNNIDQNKIGSNNIVQNGTNSFKPDVWNANLAPILPKNYSFQNNSSGASELRTEAVPSAHKTANSASQYKPIRGIFGRKLSTEITQNSSSSVSGNNSSANNRSVFSGQSADHLESRGVAEKQSKNQASEDQIPQKYVQASAFNRFNKKRKPVAEETPLSENVLSNEKNRLSGNALSAETFDSNLTSTSNLTFDSNIDSKIDSGVGSNAESTNRQTADSPKNSAETLTLSSDQSSAKRPIFQAIPPKNETNQNILFNGSASENSTIAKTDSANFRGKNSAARNFTPILTPNRTADTDISDSFSRPEKIIPFISQSPKISAHESFSDVLPVFRPSETATSGALSADRTAEISESEITAGAGTEINENGNGNKTDGTRIAGKDGTSTAKISNADSSSAVSSQKPIGRRSSRLKNGAPF